jgi:hypothetical protein
MAEAGREATPWWQLQLALVRRRAWQGLEALVAAARWMSWGGGGGGGVSTSKGNAFLLCGGVVRPAPVFLLGSQNSMGPGAGGAPFPLVPCPSSLIVAYCVVLLQLKQLHATASANT